MLELALPLLAVVAVAGLWLALPRRRGVARVSLVPKLGASPPGVKHLASRVSELSDLGLHLPAASRAVVQKRRLGALLGLR